MLFNILSYMSNQLLGVGNTAASIDELYLFLSNMTAIEYGNDIIVVDVISLEKRKTKINSFDKSKYKDYEIIDFR